MATTRTGSPRRRADWRVEGHAKWRADGSSTTAAFRIPLRPFGTEEAEDILGAGIPRQSARDPERECEFGRPLAMLDDAFAHQWLVDRAETRQLGVRAGAVRPTPRNEEHRDDRGPRYGDRVGDFRKSEHEEILEWAGREGRFRRSNDPRSPSG